MNTRQLSKHMFKAFILILILKLIYGMPTASKKQVTSHGVSDSRDVQAQRFGVFDMILKINSKSHAGDSSGTGGPASISDSVELFQGDIVMTKDIKRALIEAGTDEVILRPRRGRAKRAASSQDYRKWPVVKGLREVPYVIQPSSAPDKAVILDAIKHWTQNVPCIKFVPRVNEKDYISFFSGDGCYSMTGRTGGKQSISIGSKCAVMGIVAHEIGHALGFWHEQSRPDRDKYINILWHNIRDDKRIEFMKIVNGGTDDLGVPYDYNSLMHYGPKDFAKSPSLNSMVKKPDNSTDFGKATALSSSDIEQARRLYCPKTKECAKIYKDLYFNCTTWAEGGYCNSTDSFVKRFMDKNCTKSCICGTCDDLHPDCPLYVQGNYCSHPLYKTFMEYHCRRGCNLCS